MKKIFLMVTLAVMTFVSTSAQEIEKGSRFGATVGFGMTNVTGIDASSKFGYNLGLIWEYNFSEKLFLNTSINLQNKGFKDAKDADGQKIDGTIHAYYATLPIHIGYRFKINDLFYLNISVGPYIGYGLFGTDIEETITRQWTETHYYDNPSNWFVDKFGDSFTINKKDTSTDNYSYFDRAERLDVGVGGKVGVEFSSFQVNVGCNYGITESLSRGGHNFDINVGVAYMF